MKVATSFGITRSRQTWLVAFGTVGMITTMLVGQLFGYETFSDILSELLGWSKGASQVLAAVIVFTELLALPYLLSMYLSRLLRYISAALGFGLSGFWLFTSLTNAHAPNSGLFSNTVSVSGGLLVALWSMLLFSGICWVLLADSKFRHATS